MFDKKASQWKLSLYSNPNVYAILNGSDVSYPFGTHDWYIFNDTCKYIGLDKTIRPNIFKMPLNFNGCNPNIEFNCADGTW